MRWPTLMAAESLAGVEHLVSTVEGELRPDVGLGEILEALFPGGSVTGAPKIAAVDLIASLEPVGRGASMGALGRVYGNGDFDLALTIRTFAVAEEDSTSGSEAASSGTPIRARRLPSRSSRRRRCCGDRSAARPSRRGGRRRRARHSARGRR